MTPEQKTKLKEYCKRWNVPDWRIEADYAYTKELPRCSLRWECLRRLPEYRAAWQNWQNHDEFEFGLRHFVRPTVRGDDNSIKLQFIEPTWAGQLFDPASFWDEYKNAKLNSTIFDLAKESGQYDFYKKLGSLDQLEEAIKRDAMPSYAELIGQAVIDLIEHGHSLFVLNHHTKFAPQLKLIESQFAEVQKRPKKQGRIHNTSQNLDISAELRVWDAYQEHLEFPEFFSKADWTLWGKTILGAKSRTAYSDAKKARDRIVNFANSPIPHPLSS